MIYNILVTAIILVVSALIAKKEDKKYKKIVFVFFVLGFAVRLINIQNYPNALNVDEASSGYEAYAIGTYGIDRNGNFLPVFLKAWGSGQNALYTYILIPFVKLFGLNTLSIRLPMAIAGCISLFVMYKLLKKTKSDKLTIIGLIFFTICPWHIMKSRWGLESNLFPELILWAIYLINLYMENKKIKYMYLGSVLLRNISIFLWNSLLLFTNICYNIINCIYKQKNNNKKTKHGNFGNNICNIVSNDSMFNYKLL